MRFIGLSVHKSLSYQKEVKWGFRIDYQDNDGYSVAIIGEGFLSKRLAYKAAKIRKAKIKKNNYERSAKIHDISKRSRTCYDRKRNGIVFRR